MKKRIKIYFHRSKDSNSELANSLKIKEGSAADKNILYLGCEIETIFEIDLITGEGKLIGAESFFLSDEKYSDGEVEWDEAKN